MKGNVGCKIRNERKKIPHWAVCSNTENEEKGGDREQRDRRNGIKPQRPSPKDIEWTRRRGVNQREDSEHKPTLSNRMLRKEDNAVKQSRFTVALSFQCVRTVQPIRHEAASSRRCKPASDPLQNLQQRQYLRTLNKRYHQHTSPSSQQLPSADASLPAPNPASASTSVRILFGAASRRASTSACAPT
jgi:hypothetical protein